MTKKLSDESDVTDSDGRRGCYFGPDAYRVNMSCADLWCSQVLQTELNCPEVSLLGDSALLFGLESSGPTFLVWFRVRDS